MNENNERATVEVSPDALRRILEVHERWVRSEGKEGERASLKAAEDTEATETPADKVPELTN